MVVLVHDVSCLVMAVGVMIDVVVVLVIAVTSRMPVVQALFEVIKGIVLVAVAVAV